MHDFLHLIISLLQRGVGFAVAAVALCCAVFLVVYVLFRILTRGGQALPLAQRCLRSAAGGVSGRFALRHPLPVHKRGLV